MDLEKVVKASFENFEPEVNPSVWQSLEQNLSNVPVSSDPSGTSSLAGKTVIKTILGHVSPWIWVAGIVATTAIIALIVTSSSEKNKIVPVEHSLPVKPTTDDVVINNKKPAIPEQGVAHFTADKTTAGLKMVANNPGSKTTEVEIQLPKPNEAQASDKTHLSGKDNFIPKNETPKTQPTNSENVVVTPPDNHNNGPSADNIKPVTVIEPVIILNTQIGFAPLKIIALLNNEGLKGNWDFGDGQAALAGNTVTHSFSKPGTYKLTCTVGEAKIEKVIDVIGSACTAFTPNGDGVNDEFYIESSQLQELTVKIMDRSGKQVFEISQPGQRWDGKDTGGETLPSGTYFYNIFARSVNGQPINQKGTISIFK